MKKDRLLIIEDEASVAKQLKWYLSEVYNISISGSAEAARKQLATGAFPVAILDLGLPPHPDNPREGLKLLEEMSEIAPYTRVIVITGNTEPKNALAAAGTGAYDFCEKPVDLKTLEIILTRTFRMQALEAENRRLAKKSEHGEMLCGMLGASDEMRNLFSRIRKVSASDYPVIITGESGTGKEMVAHAVHQLSQRSEKPFVIINCGAIPENLLETELFGHEKGSFTGAAGRKTGKIELADTGTLFLDEVGELPFAMQVKLLRCLQEGTIERVGGKTPLSLDVRIVAATNIDLQAAVEKREFREDLYFRLNVVPIDLPPLKSRTEDIMLLAQNFLDTERRALKLGRVFFSADAVKALAAHGWPGNVRELKNRIRRAVALLTSQWITPQDLGLDTGKSKTSPEKFYTLQETRDRAEINGIRHALLLTGNNISQAAKLLGTSRPTMHDLIKKHGLSI